ncbi:MAG: sensor histidine kinase [Hyphomicrobium sp.]
MEHRIANSLQIIAGMLLLKAGTVRSEETQRHLKDAHRRVMSVAAVQKHLRPSGKGEQIAVGPYLSTLCQSLEQSMVGDRCPIAIEVAMGEGSLVSSDAISIGLIVTESVINALKHAFNPDDAGGRITVTFRARDLDWMLTISDNGKGESENASAAKPGLGTGIIQALGHQLGARIQTSSGQHGTTVSVVHARSEQPDAATLPPLSVIDIRDRAMSH